MRAHHHHLRGFARGYQPVEHFVRLLVAEPSVVVAIHAVQKIQHGIGAGAVGIKIAWQIYCHGAVDTQSGTVDCIGEHTALEWVLC